MVLMIQVVCGFGAGALGAAVGNPADLAMVRMQVSFFPSNIAQLLRSTFPNPRETRSGDTHGAEFTIPSGDERSGTWAR